MKHYHVNYFKMIKMKIKPINKIAEDVEMKDKYWLLDNTYFSYVSGGISP